MKRQNQECQLRNKEKKYIYNEKKKEKNKSKIPSNSQWDWEEKGQTGEIQSGTWDPGSYKL